jgi:chitinase
LSRLVNRKFLNRTVNFLLSLILVFSLFAGVSTAYADPPGAPPTLTAPLNVKVLSNTSRTAMISWDVVDNATGYDIYTGSGGYAGYVDAPSLGEDGLPIGLPVFTIKKLKPSTSYSYKISAQNNQFTPIVISPMSDVVNFTTGEYDPTEEAPAPTPPLSPPHNLKVTGMTDTTVTLNWDASVSANTNGYDIYNNGNWAAGTWTISSTTATIQGLESGKTYKFFVGAQDGTVNPPEASVPSNAVTIKLGELAAPTDLQVVAASRTTVSLGWAPTPGATSYDVYQEGTKIGSSSTNRYVTNGLNEGQEYAFKVIAKTGTLTSADSDVVSATPGKNYNIIPYFTSWSIYGRGYDVSQMDATKITHINYAFADICWNGEHGNPELTMWDCKDAGVPLQHGDVFNGELILGEPAADVNTSFGGTLAGVTADDCNVAAKCGNFYKLRQLKAANPHLKNMISVGGWSWSNRFSDMAATAVTRHTFADSAVKFLREYGFDGIDIDWEYPVEGGLSSNSKRPEDKENFKLLLQTIREALDAAGQEDGNYYLLTLASGATEKYVNNTQLGDASQYTDFINIMTYDFHGPYEALSGHNAPLYFDKNDPSPDAGKYFVNSGVTAYLNGGVPNYKLVVGVPFYGKGYKDCSATGNGQYQTCANGSIEGTWEPATFDFSDLENNYVNKDGYTRFWNDSSKVPYLYNSTNKVFITYDDQESIMYKTSYIKSLDLAGAMFWEVSGDRNKTLLTQLANDLPINASANPTVLASPTNVTVVSKGTDAIHVKWDASAGATGYDIFANRVWVGFTTETQYSVNSLAANTNYKLQIVAIQKSDNQLANISVASDELSVATNASPSTLPAEPPKSSSTGALVPQITKDGDKVVVTLPTDKTVKAIQDSTATQFQIVVDADAQKIETVLSKDIITALIGKGDAVHLSIVSNQVTYNIPIAALNLSSLTQALEIKITIEAPEQSVIDQLIQKSHSDGTKVLVNPLEFKVEITTADNHSTEITDFGHVYVSRIFTLNQKDFNKDLMTGVVYNPVTNEYHSVPTIITLNADGTLTVELKRSGNSIYSIVESNVKIQDEIAAWARKDVELAAAKLIVSGENANQFGGNNKITRAEFVSIIVKGLGILPDTESSSFKDVDNKTKFANEITAASKLGLVNGKTKDTFDPDGLITRQEMAVILEKAMKFAGKTNKTNLQVLSQYVDKTAISTFAEASLALVVEQKIMIGVSQTKLDPKSNATKNEAIVVVMKMLRALGLSN